MNKLVKKNITIGDKILFKENTIIDESLMSSCPFMNFNDSNFFEDISFEIYKINTRVKCRGEYYYIKEFSSGHLKSGKFIGIYYISKSITDPRKDWIRISSECFTLVETYWFINSEGDLCEAILGKRPSADYWRDNVGNMFKTKQEASNKYQDIIKTFKQ